jgi:RP/EB family microtubule-associated protein
VRAAAPAAARAPVRAPVRAAPAAGRQQKGMEEEILNLTGQMDEMKLSVDSLEKERDFYFAKVRPSSVPRVLCGLLIHRAQLRDIEVLVQQRFEVLEGGGEEAALELDTLKQIQAVLYSTEEGFEVPEGGEVSWCSRGRDASPGSHPSQAALLGDEEETF